MSIEYGDRVWGALWTALLTSLNDRDPEILATMEAFLGSELKSAEGPDRPALKTAIGLVTAVSTG